GSRFYQTPHLDALAAGGLRFTSYYAAPNGASSRASLVSGQYAPRTGGERDRAETQERGEFEPRKLVPPPVRDAPPPGSPSLASVLKSGGFVTGFLGRWDLGADAGSLPSQRG